MKILFITHFHGLFGANRSLLDLLDGLRGYDVQPFVIVPAAGHLCEELERRGVQNAILPITWWMGKVPISKKKRLGFFIKLFRSVWLIHKVARMWDIDLIYTNLSVTPAGRIAALLNRVPHIWHIREFGGKDYSLGFYLPKKFTVGLFNSSEAIICNSYALHNYYFGKGKKDKVSVIYNGVASRERIIALAKPKEEAVHDEPYTFLMVGSMFPNKGQDSAIRAAAQLLHQGLDIKLILVGSGEAWYIDHCQQIVNEEGINDSVAIMGYISDPYKAQMFRQSDCFLMCSENEAFGRVTAEAMAASLPVIGKNRGGTPELVDHECTGLLYSSSEELVANMSKLAQDRELGRKYGLCGWKVALDRFNIEDYAANVYQVIESVSRA